MTGVLHWLRKGCATGQHDPLGMLDACRRGESEGGKLCHNAGCEVVGHLKDFKVHCGDASQKQDWNEGGHKEKCGTFHCKEKSAIVFAPAQ